MTDDGPCLIHCRDHAIPHYSSIAVPHLLYQHGTPVAFDAETVSTSIRENRDTSIQLDCGTGEASCRFWTTDLTTEYVRLNADYHT